MFKNKFKILITGLLLCSQVMPLMGAEASPVVQPTAEEVLLTRVYQIEGEPLTKDQFRDEIYSALSSYEQNSIRDGYSGQRFADALVMLNLYAPEDAQAVGSDLQLAAGKLSANDLDSQQEVAQTMKRELQEVLSRHPAVGAQFSKCDANKASLLVAGGGAILTIAGLIKYIGSHGTALAKTAGKTSAEHWMDIGLAGFAAGVVVEIFSDDNC